MKQYPAYKDSGLAWTGNIPAHWETSRGKRLFRCSNRPVRPEDEVVTAFRDGTVTLRKNRREGGFTNSLLEIGYQGIRKGDLVIHGMDAFAGAIGVSDSDGKSTPVYSACTPLKDAHPVFFCRLLRYMSRSGYIEALARGIRERSSEFRFEQFANLTYIVPPRLEQDAIVAFLEAKEAEIQTFIANKRRTIELLKQHLSEKVATLLTRPREERYTRLSYFVNLLPGFAFASESFTNQDNDVRLLRGINVSPGEIRWDDTVRWPPSEAANLAEYALSVGDLVLGMDRPWISTGIRVAEIAAKDLPCLLVQRVARIRARRGLRQDYIKLLLGSRDFHAYFEPILTGVSVPHISPGQILGFRFRIPSPEEQKRVVQAVESEREKVAQSVATAEREIQLMEEYRTALIAAAVTGKIDVRQANRLT